MGAFDEALKVGSEDFAGLVPKVASTALKAARIATDDGTEDPFYTAITLPHVPSAEEYGYTSFLLAPSAQAKAVELNLIPFVSNVGTYLADKGILPDNGWVKLAVDATVDLGNLIPLGTLTKATSVGRRAKIISRVMEGGLKGKTGAQVVDALHGVIEMAGKIANVAPDVEKAAAAGDKAAIKSLLDGALATGKPTEEAASLLADLRKDRKALGELLENADELRSMGDLPPGFWQQGTRAERLAAGHITPLVGIVPPGNPARDPLGTLRRLVGFNYQSEIKWMPGSSLLAEALDKIAPIKGAIPLADDELSVAHALRRMNASKALSEKLLSGPGLHPFHVQMLADRFAVQIGARNERTMRLLSAAELDERGVKQFAYAMTGKAKGNTLTDEEIEAARQMLVGDVVERQRKLDTFIKGKRDELLANLTQKRRDAWASPSALEAMGAVDSAMVEADIADLRAVWEWGRLGPLASDAMGVGQALRSRAAYGSLLADQMSFGTREVMKRVYPERGDRELVASAMGQMLHHPEMWVEREGRLFLKETNPDRLKAAGANRLAKMLTDPHGGARLSQILTEQGLGGDVSQIAQSWRTLLDAAGETLVSDGVLYGTLPNYFPLVFTPSKKFFDTFKVSDKAQHKFFEVALERSDLAEIVLGAKGSGARKFSDETLALAREGKLGWAQAREWTEDVAVRMEELGYGEYEKDAIKVFHSYLDATNKALLVNRVFLDLPHMGVKIGAARIKADRLFKPGMRESALADLGAVVDEATWNALPHAERDLYTELHSTGRVLTELDDPKQLTAAAAAEEGARLATFLRAGAANDYRQLRAEAIRRVQQKIAEAERAKVAGRYAEGVIYAAPKRKPIKGGPLMQEERAGVERAEGFFPKGARQPSRAEAPVERAGLERAEGFFAEAERKAPEPEARSVYAEGLSVGARAPLSEVAAPGTQEIEQITQYVEGVAASAKSLPMEVVEKAKSAVKVMQQTRSAEGIVSEAAVAIEPEWVRTGSVPQSIKNHASIGKRLRGLVRDEFQAMRVQVDAASDAAKASRKLRALAKPADVADAKRLKVYVYKPDAAHLQEAFRLWSQEGDTPGWLNAIDRWNANLKGWVLFGDFFHFNTMAVTSFVGDPAGVYRALRDDAGKLLPGVREGALPELVGNAAAKALMGGAVGAATGVAMGADDVESIAGFSLAGALYGAAIGAAIRNGKAARYRTFNPEGLDALRRMGRAGWTGRPDDRALGTVQRHLRAIRADLIRRGYHKTADALTGGLHMMDAYEETMWGILNNGGKQAYFTHLWPQSIAKVRAGEAWKAAAAKGDTEAMAGLERRVETELMQAANNAFGGQSYANLFTNPTFQYHARRFLISPDWTSSRLAWTASIMGNMGPVKAAILGGGMGTMIDAAQAGFDPEQMSARGPVFGAAMGLALGKWNRFVIQRMRTPGDAYTKAARQMAAAALLGGYVTYNLLNKAFTGKWMWENEEGRRLSVQLPNGQVYAPGKPFTEAFEWAAIKDTKMYPDPITGRLRTKLAPVPAAFRVVLNRDSFGGPIISAGADPSDVLYKYGEILVQSTAPIGLRGFGELGIGAVTGSADATDISQAVFGVAGLPVKGKVGPIRGQSLSTPSLQAMLTPPSFGEPPNALAGSLP